jgi:hypothetical protein
MAVLADVALAYLYAQVAIHEFGAVRAHFASG